MLGKLNTSSGMPFLLLRKTKSPITTHSWVSSSFYLLSSSNSFALFLLLFIIAIFLNRNLVFFCHSFSYRFSGNDIVDDFGYSGDVKREVDYQSTEKLWLNVGYWKNAANYEKAGEDMALLMAEVSIFS